MLPDSMKQTAAGFKKNWTPLLTAMIMQIAPITIRKRLMIANMADAIVRSDGRREVFKK